MSDFASPRGNSLEHVSFRGGDIPVRHRDPELPLNGCLLCRRQLSRCIAGVAWLLRSSGFSLVNGTRGISTACERTRRS